MSDGTDSQATLELETGFGNVVACAMKNNIVSKSIAVTWHYINWIIPYPAPQHTTP